MYHGMLDYEPEKDNFMCFEGDSERGKYVIDMEKKDAWSRVKSALIAMS